MKCVELQKGDIVVFETDSQITGRREIFDGNVSFVNEHLRLACIHYIEGFENRGVFIPFSQMIAKHDPYAMVFKFGRTLSGGSILLEEYSGECPITFCTSLEQYRLLDKWSGPDESFYLLGVNCGDKNDVIAIRNGDDIIEFDYIPSREAVHSDYKDREELLLKEKDHEKKRGANSMRCRR